MRSGHYGSGGFRLADLSDGRRGRFGVLSVASGGGQQPVPMPTPPDDDDPDEPAPIGEPTGPIPVPPAPEAPPMQLMAISG